MSLAVVLRGIAGMLDEAKARERAAPRVTPAFRAHCKVCRRDLGWTESDKFVVWHGRADDCPLSNQDIPISACERTP